MLKTLNMISDADDSKKIQFQERWEHSSLKFLNVSLCNCQNYINLKRNKTKVTCFGFVYFKMRSINQIMLLADFSQLITHLQHRLHNFCGKTHIIVKINGIRNRVIWWKSQLAKCSDYLRLWLTLQRTSGRTFTFIINK